MPGHIAVCRIWEGLIWTCFGIGRGQDERFWPRGWVLSLGFHDCDSPRVQGVGMEVQGKAGIYKYTKFLDFPKFIVMYFQNL